MKFYVAVVEHRSTVVEVEAREIEEVLAKVEDAYNKDEICLPADCIDDGAEFLDETDAWTPCIENGYEVRFQKIG